MSVESLDSVFGGGSFGGLADDAMNVAKNGAMLGVVLFGARWLLTATRKDSAGAEVPLVPQKYQAPALFAGAVAMAAWGGRIPVLGPMSQTVAVALAGTAVAAVIGNAVAPEGSGVTLADGTKDKQLMLVFKTASENARLSGGRARMSAASTRLRQERPVTGLPPGAASGFGRVRSVANPASVGQFLS